MLENIEIFKRCYWNREYNKTDVIYSSSLENDIVRLNNNCLISFNFTGADVDRLARDNRKQYLTERNTIVLCYQSKSFIRNKLDVIAEKFSNFNIFLISE